MRESVSSVYCLTRPATPTIVIHFPSASRPPKRKRLPRGSSCGQYSSAIRSSMMATGGFVSVSCSIEEPPAAQRNFHGLKIISAGYALVGIYEIFAGWRRASFDYDRAPRVHLAQRQGRDRAGCCDARQRLESLPQLVIGGENCRVDPCISGHSIVSSTVNTFSGLNPGETCSNLAKLRISRPAPIRSTTESAISEITSMRRKFRPRPQTLPAPAEPRPASFRVLCKSICVARQAGARPKRIPEKTQSATVNSKASPSTPIEASRGTLFGPSTCTQCTHTNENKIPSAPPPSASNTLSVNNWRRIRPRLAPSAARTAISFCRETARESCKFATLAQAISNTNATAPSRTKSE